MAFSDDWSCKIFCQVESDFVQSQNEQFLLFLQETVSHQAQDLHQQIRRDPNLK